MNWVPQKNLSPKGVKGVPPSVRIYSPPLEDPSTNQLLVTH
jgi:hypothetical protein